MSETASISMGVASRYAKAIFDLVLETNEVAKLETDVESLARALKDSQELRDLISSPMYTRDCLLYTSPSPRDRTRSRMPSSA